MESIQNMTEDELRVLELSVKMRDVLSKEKSNALRECSYRWSENSWKRN